MPPNFLAWTNHIGDVYQIAFIVLLSVILAQSSVFGFNQHMPPSMNLHLHVHEFHVARGSISLSAALYTTSGRQTDSGNIRQHQTRICHNNLPTFRMDRRELLWRSVLRHNIRMSSSRLSSERVSGRDPAAGPGQSGAGQLEKAISLRRHQLQRWRRMSPWSATSAQSGVFVLLGCLDAVISY